MTLLYADSRFLDHDTGAHPESAVRLRHINARLESTGLAAKCKRPVWTPAEEAQLLAVHDRAYLEQLAAITGRGGGQLDSDTVVSPSSYDVARLAAGAACDAVRRVVTGDDSHACASRGRQVITRYSAGPWDSACSATLPWRRDSPSTNWALTAC
jgi:acetoin utilization deacetylase AcuC-like enzyme